MGQFHLDDGGPCLAFVATAMEAVVQLDGFQSMVDNPLNALPDRLQKPDPTVIPAAFRDQNNNYPKKLAWNGVVSPGRLDQLNKETPTIPCTVNAVAFRVLLPLHAIEPLPDVFSTHAKCTHRLAIGKLANYLP